MVDSFSVTTAAKEEEEKDEEATTGVILVHGEEGKDLVVKKACREEEGERELSRTEERRSRRAAIGDGNAAMLKIDRQSHRQTDRQKRRREEAESLSVNYHDTPPSFFLISSTLHQHTPTFSRNYYNAKYT